jgi:photosystem II stability/assembly factor-like uncharacterized protein
LKQILAIKLFLSALFVLATSALGQAPRFDSWKIVGQGGGGTMIAPTISPHDSRLVVEHCDMTGGYISHDDGDSWRMFNLRSVIETFAFDPTDKDVIYAGNEALWRSENRGKSWRMVFPDPNKNTVEHQVGDHADIFFTSDDPSYPGPGSISAIAIDPQDSKRLYISFKKSHSTSAVYISTDRGATWKQLASISQSVILLTFHEGSLIAVAGKGAYRLSGEGNVAELGQLNSNISVASVAHVDKATWIYATTQDGKIVVSETAGDAWRDVTPSLGPNQEAVTFHAISASDQHGEVAYAGFRPRGVEIGTSGPNLYNGIIKTIDGGKTWNTVYKESTIPAKNLDRSWIEQRAAVPGTESIFPDAPWSLGVAPTDPNICYATDLFRTYRTLDGGKTWKDVNSKRIDGDKWTTRGLDVTTIHGVQFDPFNSKHVFIDYTDIGLFQSQNGGISWKSTSSGVPENWRNTTYWLAFDPAVKGLIWGAFSGVHDLPRPKMWRTHGTARYKGGVAVSTDGGYHWTPSNLGMPPTAVTHILLDPGSPVGKRVLYATAFGRGVYKSVDNGKSWILKNDGISGTQPFTWRLTQDKEGTLYLVVARSSEGISPPVPGPGALYRSTDKAEHWVKMNLPDGVNGPTKLAIDPRDSKRLYLSAWGHEGESVDSGGGVFLSVNAGETWESIFSNSQHVFDLTMDPQDPEVLYIAGFDSAAYRSIDHGAHWNRIKGYNFKWGYRVIPDPNDPEKIYITTYGGGLWHGPAAGDPEAQEDITTPIAVAH